MHQPPWLPRMPCPISACLRGKEPPSEVPSSALIIPVETYPLSNSSSQKEGGINSPPAAIWHPTAFCTWSKCQFLSGHLVT